INRQQTNPISLTKVWEGGSPLDDAELSIAGTGVSGASGATSTIPSSPTFPFADNTNVASAVAVRGSTVTISELLPTQNVGAYTAEFACTQGGSELDLTHTEGILEAS